MATINIKVCDLCPREPGVDPAAARTMRGSFSTGRWEIELCDAHEKLVIAQIAEVLHAARRQSAQGRPRRNTPRLYGNEDWAGKKWWACPHTGCEYAAGMAETMRKHLRRTHNDYSTVVSSNTKKVTLSNDNGTPTNDAPPSTNMLNDMAAHG